MLKGTTAVVMLGCSERLRHSVPFSNTVLSRPLDAQARPGWCSVSADWQLPIPERRIGREAL